MFPQEWERYRTMEVERILAQILEESIEKQEQGPEKVRSRILSKTRRKWIACLAAAAVILAVCPREFRFLTMGPIAVLLWPALKGTGCAVALVMGFVELFFGFMVPGNRLNIIWMLLVVTLYGHRILTLGRQDRVDLLIRQAKQNPDKELDWIVAEDMEICPDTGIIAVKIRNVLIALLVVAICGLGLFLNRGTESTPNTEREVESVRMEPEAAYTWEQTDSGYILRNFDAGTGEINPVIPESIQGIPVVAIGDDAFRDEYRIQEVVLPDTVTVIGYQAFRGCKAMKSITMGDGITKIGGEAFADCSSLETVDIPQGVTVIGSNTFSGCTSLKTVTVPDTVTVIDSYSFRGCTALESIALGDQITAIGGEAFYGCTGLKSVVIPKGVTEIRGGTFQNCSMLESVTLHDGIIDIHAYAFQDCPALRSIDLPSGITEIHTYTFAGCTSLETVEIPRGVTRIAAHAFDGCSSLKKVTVPDTVEEIRSSAFRSCSSLTEIVIPQNCTVDERSFKDSPTKVTRR